LKIKNLDKGEINMTNVVSFIDTKQTRIIDKEQMAQGYMLMSAINLGHAELAASTNYDGEEFINSIK
jgi:hypothetical protein